MSKGTGVWLGPELYWLVWYALSRIVALFNRPASQAGNAWMTHVASWVLPCVAVALSFWVFFQLSSPEQSRGGVFWTRLVLATLVGMGFCLGVLVETIDYHDSRNAGVPWIWMIGMMAGGGMFLLICAVMSGRWLLRWWQS